MNAQRLVECMWHWDQNQKQENERECTDRHSARRQLAHVVQRRSALTACDEERYKSPNQEAAPDEDAEHEKSEQCDRADTCASPLSEQRICDVPSVELTDRKQVQGRYQEPEPSSKRQGV